MNSSKSTAVHPQGVKKSPRRTQERTEITRAKLLEAATRLFTEHGFEGVSIRDIENHAEDSRGYIKFPKPHTNQIFFCNF